MLTSAICNDTSSLFISESLQEKSRIHRNNTRGTSTFNRINRKREEKKLYVREGSHAMKYE